MTVVVADKYLSQQHFAVEESVRQVRYKYGRGSDAMT